MRQDHAQQIQNLRAGQDRKPPEHSQKAAAQKYRADLQVAFGDDILAQAAAIGDRQHDRLAKFPARLGANSVSDKVAQRTGADAAFLQVAFQFADHLIERPHLRAVGVPASCRPPDRPACSNRRDFGDASVNVGGGWRWYGAGRAAAWANADCAAAGNYAKQQRQSKKREFGF